MSWMFPIYKLQEIEYVLLALSWMILSLQCKSLGGGVNNRNKDFSNDVSGGK